MAKKHSFRAVGFNLEGDTTIWFYECWICKAHKSDRCSPYHYFTGHKLSMDCDKAKKQIQMIEILGG